MFFVPDVEQIHVVHTHMKTQGVNYERRESTKTKCFVMYVYMYV